MTLKVNESIIGLLITDMVYSTSFISYWINYEWDMDSQDGRKVTQKWNWWNKFAMTYKMMKVSKWIQRSITKIVSIGFAQHLKKSFIPIVHLRWKHVLTKGFPNTREKASSQLYIYLGNVSIKSLHSPRDSQKALFQLFVKGEVLPKKMDELRVFSSYIQNGGDL